MGAAPYHLHVHIVTHTTDGGGGNSWRQRDVPTPRVPRYVSGPASRPRGRYRRPVRSEPLKVPRPRRLPIRSGPSCATHPRMGGVLENWPLRRATSFCSKHKYYNCGRPKPWFRVRVAPARKVLVACHPGRPPIFHELDVRC